MERCVQSARAVGVFKDFHVLTDRALAGCECYDALNCDKSDGMFKLHYLKAAISKLPFKIFVWVDADTLFVRTPIDLTDVLGRSPCHMPLESELETASGRQWDGLSCENLLHLFKRAGVVNSVRSCRSAFWMVRRDAIDVIYELAFGFWHLGKEAKLTLSVGHTLAYAMQMLCANPERHLVARRSDLWAEDNQGLFANELPNGNPWEWKDALGHSGGIVDPAIIHLPCFHG